MPPPRALACTSSAVSCAEIRRSSAAGRHPAGPAEQKRVRRAPRPCVLNYRMRRLLERATEGPGATGDGLLLQRVRLAGNMDAMTNYRHASRHGSLLLNGHAASVDRRTLVVKPSTGAHL